MSDITVEVSTILGDVFDDFRVYVNGRHSLAHLRGEILAHMAHMNLTKGFKSLYVWFDGAEKAPITFTTPSHNADDTKVQTCVSDGKVSVVAFVSLMPDPMHDSQDQSVDSLTRLLDVADLNEGSAKRAKH